MQYNLVAIPFSEVGTGEGFTIDDLFAGKSTNVFTAAASYPNADQIQLWNGTKYNTLYLNSNTATSTANKAKNGHWCLTGAAPDSSWGSSGGVCTKKFPAGTSFWIKRKIPTGQTAADLPALSVPVAGQVVVKQDGKAGYTINAGSADAFGYTLIASGFSAGFSPNPDLAFNDETKRVDWITMGCHAASSYPNADQLQFWDGGKYNTLYLNSNTSTSTANKAKNGHWCLTGAAPDSSWGSNGGACTKTFEPTTGFWYKRAKSQPSFTFYIDQPYSL